MELVEGQTPAKTLRPVRSRSSELALARRIAEALEAAHEKGIEVGVILGTASYMSPDQARGLPADHRSDIFSFGVVLYEMLTGRQPFQGESVSDVLASVLAREPDLSSLRRISPRVCRSFSKAVSRNIRSAGGRRSATCATSSSASPRSHAPRPPERPPRIHR
jgi:serine/threonine-protein kinase